MMNVEVKEPFDEQAEIHKCWTYIATKWRDEWLKRICKDWEDFQRRVRAARRNGDTSPCDVCGAQVDDVRIRPPCCGFCDRCVMPYPANPRNRDLFNRYIKPELERRKIPSPF